MTLSSVTIQITSESRPAIPSWMGEVAAFAQVLTHTGILKKIQDQVRFSRARFGQYDLIDFVAVLIGYAVSGEPTLLAFYERLAPFAEPFMALFGRDQLPHRSTLSRFLAALDQNAVEALRVRFQEDLLARNPFASPGGVFDRTGGQWLVVDVDGTRQAARQRALPQLEALPAPQRRFDHVCAPGYQGRKRGEVVRTRTVVLQAHTHQFLGTFGGSGNGDYRGELRRAIQVITTYATQLGLPTASILVRLDGLYGDAAPLLDVLSADLGVIARSRAYHLLDLEMVKQTLARAPVHVSTHPESGMTRTLYDCPAVPLTPTGKEVRLVVATTHGFPGSAFTPQPDGTLRCPANHPLYPQERRPERDGSLRILYAARIGHCRSCQLRTQCQESSDTIKPRRVSAVLSPIDSSPPACPPSCSDGPAPRPLAPVLWRDWPRCRIRRAWLERDHCCDGKPRHSDALTHRAVL